MDTGIGSFLRQARLNAKLTQEAAAKLAGMSRQQVNRIENGESGTEWETVEKLVAAYKCSKSDAVRVFTGTLETKPDLRLARRLGDILVRAEPAKREQIVNALELMAEKMVGMLSEGPATPSPNSLKISRKATGKRPNNAVLYRRFGPFPENLLACLPGNGTLSSPPIPAG